MSQPESNLRAGALKLPSVIMQAVTHIAPAAGLILTLQLITRHAAQTVPLAFAIAFLIVLSLGVSLAELAKHLPSAGGYYTYVSRTVHPRAGFLTAWLYFLYDPVGAAINLAFVGYMTQNSLWEAYHLWFPWWALLILATFVIALLAYRGIEVSVEFMIVLGVAEIVLLFALAMTGLIWPGEGGVDLHSFSPASVPKLGGLCLAVVYAIFCFSGFESVAPLAEESENPRRNLPRAIIGAVLMAGAFYVLCSWGLLVGWGTNALPQFLAIPDSAENPLFQLARRLWGHGWILILLALLNSALGVSVASHQCGHAGVLRHGAERRAAEDSCPGPSGPPNPHRRRRFPDVPHARRRPRPGDLDRTRAGIQPLGRLDDPGNGLRLLCRQSGRLPVLPRRATKPIQFLPARLLAAGVVGGNDLGGLQVDLSRPRSDARAAGELCSLAGRRVVGSGDCAVGGDAAGRPGRLAAEGRSGRVRTGGSPEAT